jgi:hypothetical protein
MAWVWKVKLYTLKRNWIKTEVEIYLAHSEAISVQLKLEIIALRIQYQQPVIPVVFLPGSKRKYFLPQELLAIHKVVKFFQPHHFHLAQTVHATRPPPS